MAMYYYASKISAVAFCGTRCRQNTLHKTQIQDREKNCCLGKSHEEVMTSNIIEMVNTIKLHLKFYYLNVLSEFNCR